VLRVHVNPGGARPGIAGLHGDTLRVRVSARPVDGAANRELVRVLARALGVRAAAVTIEAGDRGREKRVRVAGLAVETVRSVLAPVLCVDRAGAHN
jgi:uncharacterized protein (TIGR00251 family)